jgi:hypothetical protein
MFKPSKKKWLWNGGERDKGVNIISQTNRKENTIDKTHE